MHVGALPDTTNNDEISKPRCEPLRQGMCGVRELRHKLCLPDTWLPLGVSNQAPDICGYVQVILLDSGTCGTRMDQVDKKNDYKEILQGVATLCSK